ncbi:MAG: non-heme iron oxygenase ferredoxin subunit [Actinomycetota bacterium]|jgi:3-phenylpropionate/trans-cinnamate dioxygenase ferredoxin subunit
MTTTQLGDLSTFPDGSASAHRVGSRNLVVVRFGEDLFILDDRCSHEDFPLSLGEVNAETREIECERHGAMFDVASGQPTSFPATRAVPTYTVRVVDGQVEVDLP